ncbi:MAG: hypothetical protein IJ789_03900 [Bacteroidales bacterium]|nr:hypothetical protein [Bacteroidales bacterium]
MYTVINAEPMRGEPKSLSKLVVTTLGTTLYSAKTDIGNQTVDVVVAAHKSVEVTQKYSTR